MKNACKISVDQNGAKVFDDGEPNSTDQSQKLDGDPSDIFVTIFAAVANSVAKQINSELKDQLEALKLPALQQFIFPSAKVFTYKTLSFS